MTKYFRALGFLLTFAVLSAFPAARAADCPGNVQNATEVTITIVKGETWSLSVDPDSTVVHMEEGQGKPGRVCWAVDGLEEDLTVHIAGKSGEDTHFPAHGRTVRLPRDFANSGKPAREGTWRYDVWVTRDGVDAPILSVDPEVIIKPGGGRR